MRVEPLPLRGAALLHGQVATDDRGTFRRAVDLEALRAHGLDAGASQVSVATNRRAGTLRGMHWQAEPHGEAKTLWCSAGSVLDVLVDLRPDEPTYGRPWSVVLRADGPVALHVPRGVAHGYQTLEDDSTLTYVISSPYVAEAARSVQALDPHLGIAWPLPVTAVSDRDREAPPWPPSP